MGRWGGGGGQCGQGHWHRAGWRLGNDKHTWVINDAANHKARTQQRRSRLTPLIRWTFLWYYSSLCGGPTARGRFTGKSGSCTFKNSANDKQQETQHHNPASSYPARPHGHPYRFSTNQLRARVMGMLNRRRTVNMATWFATDSQQDEPPPFAVPHVLSTAGRSRRSSRRILTRPRHTHDIYI